MVVKRKRCDALNAIWNGKFKSFPYFIFTDIRANQILIVVRFCDDILFKLQQSVGCIIRTTENDTAIIARMPNRTLTIPTFWVFERSSVLSSVEGQAKFYVDVIDMWICVYNGCHSSIPPHIFVDLFRKIKKTKPPLSLYGQILWREFFYCAATKNKKFDRMKGNPICVQIPWEKNPEALSKWANVSENFKKRSSKIETPLIESIFIYWIFRDKRDSRGSMRLWYNCVKKAGFITWHGMPSPVS